ncbi:protein of unknown function [Micropruina glycogenica]|uniref:Uncharacterized protein n=1 Tax=Micropruina glycogenica TaxID=75385 RepID=A0A2N9JG81_9ACTN|nr:protein of unknown function [Micropruina glycogenica]
MGHSRDAARRGLLLRRRDLHHDHQRRRPGWLHLLILLFVWNAFKFLWIGPVSLLLMAGRTARARRTHA